MTTKLFRRPVATREALADAPPPPDVWLFDDYGTLAGSQKARLSPIDWTDGRTLWIYPPNATLIAPPVSGDGTVAVFSDGGWSRVEDHRGLVAFDKTTRAAVVIEAPGPIDDTLTLIAPTAATQQWNGKEWETPLDVVKAQRLADVRAELTQRNIEGFVFGKHTYQLDDASQGRITALALLAQTNRGANWPIDFAFITADNQAVPFTAADFITFAIAAAQAVIKRRLNARSLKDAVLAAPDADVLAAVDTANGWD